APLADEHLPESERRFGVCEEIGVGAGRFAQGSQRFLSVAAAQYPLRPPRYLRVDDVIDPGAGDAGANVLWIHLQHGVERPPCFPVLIPAGLAVQRTEL